MVHNQSQSFILDLLIIRMLYLGLTYNQEQNWDPANLLRYYLRMGGTPHNWRNSFIPGHHIKILQQLPTALVNTVLRYLA